MDLKPLPRVRNWKLTCCDLREVLVKEMNQRKVVTGKVTTEHSLHASFRCIQTEASMMMSKCPNVGFSSSLVIPLEPLQMALCSVPVAGMEFAK